MDDKKTEAEKIAEKQSERVFWVIQTVFGYIIGRSFASYGAVFIPPFNFDWFTLTLAFISVYACVIWSWIDFSYTLIKSPYNFQGNAYEKFRFLSDLFIVLIYSYLLLTLDSIKGSPGGNLLPFFVAFSAVYGGYILSGVLRRLEYGKRASRLTLINCFFALYSILAALYWFLAMNPTNVIRNRWFIFLSIVLTIGYRQARNKISRRRYRIGVDVDGVLANQIDGILPVIANKYGRNLKYADVVDWKLPINDTVGIDKVIVEEQSQKTYIENMPLHEGAKDIMERLVEKYYVDIATARPPHADVWTKAWLRKKGIPYDTYHNLKEGGKQNANESFDVLIDDFIGNITGYLKNGGGKAILFSQPWNSDVSELQKYIDEGRVVIVGRWIDVPGVIGKLLG